MASVFSSAAGLVVRVDSGRPTIPFRIDFEQGNSRTFIVTQAGIEQQGNFQFLHTLQDMIYVYTFGDRISELQVSGIAFAAMCGGGSSSGSGMGDALEFYEANRISQRVTPVKIQFGERAFQSFLTGCRVEVARPEVTLGQWAFRFNSFPAR